MILLNYIDTNLKPLQIDAEIYPENFKWSFLPIVNELGEIVGTIDSEDYFNFEPSDKTINASLLVPPYKHPLECIQLFDELATNVLFVVDNGRYLGAITLESIQHYFSQYVQRGSAILVVEVSQYKFSLAEFSSIIESEANKLLSFYSRYIADDQLEITAVLQHNDLSRWIGVLENKGYTIVQLYNEEGFQPHLQSRYENLMNYLNL